ncbi:site-specific integrase [bacterium]|nr:site-specific integrase [bacterium]
MVFGRDRMMLAPRGSKCDQWGTCHGTEPIILPYHDDPLNAAKWLREILLRNPVHGAARERTALFGDERGQPFNDSTFSAIIMASLRAVLGSERAKLLSPHSWRVWLASSLRMCGASDARIQAMGRWLNPDSIKIYARMTKQEYGDWVDKLMAVRRIDTARTTSLPVMDLAGAIEAYGEQLKVEAPAFDSMWDAPAPVPTRVAPAPLKRGARVSVYWTDMKEWLTGTFATSRVEEADGGGKQRSCCIVYDPHGPWSTCNKRQLTYWHCLDDELWTPIETEA